MSNAEREPPGPAIVKVDVEPEYVLGFPIYVALTVGCTAPGASLSWLPLPAPHALRDAVGIRLWRPGEPLPFFEDEPSAVVDPDLGTPMLRLRAGEVRRLLVEVAGLLPPLDPGVHEAMFLYGAPPLVAESGRTALRLRDPTDAERAALDAVRGEVEEAGSFGRWALAAPADPDRLAPPTDPQDPLRYPRMIRYLRHGPIPLDRVDPASLSVLGGVFVADAQGLFAELLAARDPAAFTAHAPRVKAAFPGLAAWIDAIAAGQSDLVWARRQG